MIFLGIDTSTTATKALLMNSAGDVLGVASSEYAYETPRPGWTEQDPELFWRGTVESIRTILKQTHVDPKDVAAIGLTGQMHGLVLLDAQGKVLRPCILWNDQRSARECEIITGRVGAERLLTLTGNPALTGFTAPKLLWVQRNEPEVYAQVAHVLLPKDYVRYRLTGKLYTDVSDASGTSWLDVSRRRWSDEVLDALEVPPVWLPEVVESPDVCAGLSAEAANRTGLRAGISIAAGAGDQAAGAVGMGLSQPGAVSVSLGTSGVVFAPASSYQPESQGRLHTFAYIPAMWHWMGVMLSAGGSLRWFRDALGGGLSYDELTNEAADVEAGCEGLLFLPYLTGERTPHADPNARGAFAGLTVRHSRAHLARAVIEGVSFGLRDSLELMRGLGLAPGQVRVSGGGAKSALWRQILADVLNVEIVTVNSREGAAYGGAMLAAVGVQAFPDVHAAAERMVRITGQTSPGANAELYEEIYPRYQALYPALRSVFKQG